ncbi:DUF1330 domain-containing protein [Erythrobacter alti]|uniref:DUF1330 domain-containing protein n=1 Tax=Erythrobacter alti TaxID=1896145 RepID=UPI0030F48F6A
MPAYIMFTREEPVADESALARYSAANRANAADWQKQFSITPLAVYGRLETLEGESADGVVLLQFPTMADARAWYDSPEYQAAIADRHRAAPYRAIMFEGF